MTAERYRRVKEIFLRVRDLPVGERGDAIAAACGEDAALREEVESLLSIDAAAALEPPIADGSLLEDGVEGSDPIGARIGRYRIERLIAAGGMGRVYEASQESPRRSVALKIMRRGLVTRDVLRRFELEVELLGRLRHPGIAHVYDAGVWKKDGERIPYFAMELVPDAQPVTDYAERHRLDARARVELMVQVSEAVLHGHQQGVIHRDLKPANILVDGAGRPKVIDFGVARATASDLAWTTVRTHVGEFVGTLQYMSPEQCGADPSMLDMRSDVYSLGVVLYELLCGRLPHDISTLSIPAAALRIREEAPPRPSAIRKALRGDLEAIVLKALERNREVRYASASDLANDLRRFLSGERVEARSPTMYSSIVHWITRHPLLATAAACALIAAAALGLSVGGIWYMNKRPARVVLDTSTRRTAWLESAAGRRLRVWDGGAPQTIQSIHWVDRPRALGGGALVLVSYSFAATGESQPGELCAYAAEDPREPLWSTKATPLRPPDDWSEHIDATFTVDDVLVADVLPDSPGDEIVVVQHLWPASPSAIRIFDLSGKLHFMAWHYGLVCSVRWLAASQRLVASGVNSEVAWGGRAMERPPKHPARYPTVVFALEPKDELIKPARWIVRNGRRSETALKWYKWLGPAELLEPLGDAACFLDWYTSALDPARHVQVWVRLNLQRSPTTEGALFLTVDDDGREVARFVDSSYQAKQRDGELPEDGKLRLFDYEDLPPVRD